MIEPVRYFVLMLRSLIVIAVLVVLVALPLSSQAAPLKNLSWWAEYFDNPSLSGRPVLTRYEDTMNHDWGACSPAPEVPCDNFSARWTITRHFEKGTYLFLLTVDDGARVWLVNTGWTGGAFGTGSRMKLAHTRAMLRAALSGALDSARFTKDPVFGFEVPVSVPDVPDGVLSPRATWPDSGAYDTQARKLATMFRENFEQYRSQVPAAVAAAGPVV